MSNDPTEPTVERPGVDAGDARTSQSLRAPSRSLHAPSRSLHEMADLLGGRVWLERRLFESLGRWAGDAAEDSADGAAMLHLAEASRRHGWHAQVWFDRMPELSGFDVEGRVVAPDARLVTLLDLLDGASTASRTIVRLDGYARVLLPRMIVAYRSTLEQLGAAADASVARWSRLVLVDDLDEWERAEAVLQQVVRTDEHLDALAVSRRGLDELLVGAPLLPT